MLWHVSAIATSSSHGVVVAEPRKQLAWVGWATGGGAIQLIIPQIYDSLLKHYPSFVAWRWAFFFPGTLHVAVAALVLFAATV